MGWIKDKITRKKQTTVSYAEMLNGYSPIFTQFGEDIFASDAVKQAVNCIVTELQKLRPLHVKYSGNDCAPVQGSQLQRILNRPNELMTTADLLSRCGWALFLRCNAYIIPTYYIWKDNNGNEKRVYTGLYPVEPDEVTFLQDQSNKIYIRMHFQNGFETELPYADVIHIRRQYAVNEFLGGDASGNPDNRALLKTLKINHEILESVAKATKSSMAVNAVIQYAGLINKETIEENILELEDRLKKNQSGFLSMDMAGKYTPITKNIKLVDEATLKFIDEKILRNFGVSIPILTGDYTKNQYEAFYQKAIEPIIIAMSQEFTKKLFTPREESFGNQIDFATANLVFMTTDQKLEFVRLLGDSGTIFENEKRQIFGFAPIPELYNIRMQSLNYVNSKFADKYQVGDKAKGDTNDEK